MKKEGTYDFGEIVMREELVRPSLKERQRQEREELILQAAEDILLEKGYRDMLMDEIAACVGIAKSTVYMHFPSKDDLVVALIERKLAQFLTLLTETMTQDIPACKKLDILFQRLYIQSATMCQGRSSASLPLFVAFYNSTDMHHILGKVAQHTHELRTRIHDCLLALLEEGQQSGELDCSLPPEVMLSGFFNMMAPRSFERLIAEQFSLDELVHYIKYMYFKSIAAPPTLHK